MQTAQTEIEQQGRLARMKAIATGLLLLMSVVFAATYSWPEAPWIGYLRAFAEAGMVGALADWFAVTALFRHPLGLPIPHTAIVPRRKDQIGDSLARFVGEHFLNREALSPRLESLDFAVAAGRWLARPENATKLTADAAAVLRWLLATVDDRALREFLRDRMQVSLRQVRVTPLLGRLLDLLVSADRHQELMDTAVRIASEQLEQNKYAIRARIEAQSPWWLPDFVDQEIYDKIVSEIELFLQGVGTDASHPARQKFNEGVSRFIARLKTDGEVIARIETLKEEILDSPNVQRYLANIWALAGGHLSDASREPDSELNQRLRDGFVSLGEALLADPAMRTEVNRWLGDAILYIIRHYRDEMAGVISDTVRAWDPRATARRVELQVGRDLQFIRINGTLVGGLAGVVIHAIVTLL